MEGLALAERHSLTGIAVEISTTLISLDDSPDLDKLPAARRGAAERARAEGHVEAELRALYFSARFQRDRGDFAGAVEVYDEVIRRGEEVGLRWAPFPAEARWMKATVLTVLGRLDEAWSLLDVGGLNPPMVYEWLYFAHRVHISVIRGTCKPDSFTALRDYWSRDGLIAIVGGSAELVRADRATDPERATEIYDQVVATVRPLWHEWFRARLRLDRDRHRGPRERRFPAVRRPARGRRTGRPPHAARRRTRHRLLCRIRHLSRPRIPGSGGAPRRRGPALPVAEPARPARQRRARLGLARHRGGLRRVRRRLRDRTRARPLRRGAARDR
ncbi:hypothetical protein [Nocardioides sp. B-3]|uniref:hypothetical protein n=1 Tax=Nocardioides sp. B-3 TaxID=2895565 RepID=UPI002152EE90|nr:hypothetical protein [Nocardioides sp. B-3]UUZ61415.1 hypothetical protein LP418_13070 [Nocardioides sp. B-3]